MNIKVVEYSIFVLSVTVIYLIVVCRDLQHTNDLQDTALDELTKSLPLLVKTNIDSYHHNNHDNIKTEYEILKNERTDKKDKDPHQDTMNEDLPHDDETKREKYTNIDDTISRKAHHRNYDKNHYGHDVSLVQKYDYRKSFDAAHRIKNNKNNKSMKKIWAEKQSFLNKSHKVTKSKEPVNNNWKSLKQNQEQDFQERKKQLYKNTEHRKLTDKILNETTATKEINVVTSLSEDIQSDEEDIYQTSCVLTKAEFIPPCDNYDYYISFCSDYALDGRCTEDWMLQTCQKSCDACPPPVPLLDYQVQHEEYENTITTYNLSLDFQTDEYANETSWTFISRGMNDSIIVNSNELNATSKLENNKRHVIQYNCIVSQKQEHEDKLSDDKTSTCYDFKVHDSYGDGICCEYGDGFFSMNIITNTNSLNIEDQFEDGILISSSFCINSESGEIESEGKFITTEKPSHYPFRWQCKNEVCLCDSKPSLTSNIHENHLFLLEVAMLSDSDKLHDMESAQYKAACWVLYDDPYEYHDLVREEVHKRMIQRYILAVFYFETSPDTWEDHSDFLSSRSECEWDFGSVSCDEDDNVICIYLIWNNLDGTIVDELSGLRMLEKLHLYGNKIDGTIPPVLGRLSNLRDLKLDRNGLEGTIPPQLFNARNLEELHLYNNRLEGTIPETIRNLQKLSGLYLESNNLSGSIPKALYKLENLQYLHLDDNKLSSSISPLIGNLKKLEQMSLSYNMLTGQISSSIGSLSSLQKLDLENNKLSGPIPSTIGNMTSLFWLHIHNNTLSGSIPESLFDAPLLSLNLQDNSVTGSIPNEFCDSVFVAADCRNDVFDPEVSCSCCSCKDESPIWDGKCIDATIKIVIDHRPNIDRVYGSLNFKWSLINDAIGEIIPFDGSVSYEDGLETHEACVVHSDCFSLNQIDHPVLNTNYTIFWNDESIYNGTFLGYEYNDDINVTVLSFQYDEKNQQVTSCHDIKMECYEKKQPILLQPNTTERIMYNQATKISNKAKIHDSSSPQSKALCWMLHNNHYGNKSDISDTDIIQRYVLAILHFMSQNGLFGHDENLSEKHECDWKGITCKVNTTKIVTGISLSSKDSQIISGTLIEEIGSLQYLKVLELSQTQLHGAIPRSFSNLWSLTKLDLSDNKINSTLPATLFRHLNELEHIDLSNNTLRGSINKDIGSFSRIRSLSLNKNELTGSLPLEGFKHYDLEHLNISGNALSEIDFSLLLKHNNLKFLDISDNFFVGSLMDDTFTSLAQLRYFNASKNDISGIIPSTFPELSNITHIDLHINKLRGPIPLGITELRNIQLLNLQGNKLTGSLLSELNQLKNLEILVLSHNEFKGSIPFNQSNLHKMKRLHLHSNKLEGEAPQFSSMTSYITDCGFPSDSLDPVTCSTCNTCCNSDGGCQSKSSEELGRIYLTLIFMFTIVGFIIVCYALKDRITSNKYLTSFFEEKVKNWNALMLISDKSVYHFLLIDNKTEWYVAFVCGIFQTATLFLFVHSANMVNDTSDREYFMLCPANSLECDDLNKVSPYGIFIFGLILTIWLLRDIIGSLKLMLVSFEKKNIDFFFTSAVVFSVTMLSLWTSIIYIYAIAEKNTDMIKDAVVLLFVVEIDERLFQLVESLNPDWVHAIDRNMRNSLVYEGKNLIISSWMMKIFESLESMGKMIRQRRNNNVPPRLDSEIEGKVSRRDSDVSEGFHVHALEAESVESNP